MSQLEAVKALGTKLNQPGLRMDDLASLFEAYKQVLAGVMASDASYQTSLRRQHEELPDLQRLIGKKHDAILKGRLTDGLRAVRKKIEELEQPDMQQPEATEAPGTDAPGTTPDAPDQQERRFRNMPTLGMD